MLTIRRIRKYSMKRSPASQWKSAPAKSLKEIWNLGVIKPQNKIVSNSITWLIPEIHLNSGGLLNIFRFNQALEKKGFQCHFCILSNAPKFPESELNDLINSHFCETRATLAYGIENVHDSDYFIATYWSTAYFLDKIQTLGKKVYFIQDLEYTFYPRGCEYAAVEGTYNMGFRGITAGSWLARTLESKYSMQTSAYGFSTNRKIYFPNSGPFLDKVITCYVRKDTARRGFNTAIQALIEVSTEVPDVRVQFIGMDMNDYSLPFPHSSETFGAEETLAKTLRNSRVTLVISFTNASLLPLDSIGCGTPVVYPEGDNIDWLMGQFSDGASQASPTALAKKLIHFLTDDSLYISAREQGLKKLSTMPSWDEQYEESISETFKLSSKVMA